MTSDYAEDFEAIRADVKRASLNQIRPSNMPQFARASHATVGYSFKISKPRPQTSKLRGGAVTVQRVIPNIHQVGDQVGDALNQDFGYTEKDSQLRAGVAYNTQQAQMKHNKPSSGSYLQSEGAQTTTQRATNSVSATGRMVASGNFLVSQQSAIGP